MYFRFGVERFHYQFGQNALHTIMCVECLFCVKRENKLL
jgi:hypothetical protein